MRSLPHLLSLVFLVPRLLSAGDLPTVKATLPDLAVAKNTVIPPVNLLDHFEVTSISGQIVQFASVLGTFNVEMATASAPATVANFLTYVNSGALSNTIIHRSDQPLRVIQGGSYRADNGLTAVPVNAPIPLEAGNALLNARGIIAMARTGDPNSATSGWFINTADNSFTLPSASNGGYAAFGRVTGSGMNVVDAIAGLTVLNGNVTVTSSSTTSTSVTISSRPVNFGPGWLLLGTTVQSITGNSVRLVANANQNIGAATSVATNRFGSPFSQLPIIGNPGPLGAVLLDDLVVFRGITPATVFPSTPPINVTTSSTATKLVTTTGLPAGFGIGSVLLGSPVDAITGNLVFLKNNANRTITSSTSVPTTIAAEKSVVTFSLENSNPGLVAATITGSALEMRLVNNRGGNARLVVKATDSNGNGAQIPFRISVTAGHAAPTDFNGDGFDDLLFQNSIGQIHSWFLDGTGNPLNFSTGSGLKPGSKNLYSASLGTWRVVGKADINTDGFQDLVLQDSVGKIFAWFLDGSGNALNFTTLGGLKPGSKSLYSQSVGAWRIVGVNDINSDGFPDLIFQNSIGQIYVWFLDGTGNALNFATGAGLKPGSKLLSSAGLGSWRVAGVNDFNGDGFADLLFQNTIGQIYVWFLDGTGNEVNFSTGVGLRPGSKLFYSPSIADWRVVGTNDINNDGSPDLVFQTTFGQVAAWFLDGTGNAIDFSTGSGLKSPPSVFLYSSGMGAWRLR